MREPWIRATAGFTILLFFRLMTPRPPFYMEERREDEETRYGEPINYKRKTGDKKGSIVGCISVCVLRISI